VFYIFYADQTKYLSIFSVFKDCRDLDIRIVPGWCGHGFEFHSKAFLLTYLKVDVRLSRSVFIISQRFLQLLPNNSAF